MQLIPEIAIFSDQYGILDIKKSGSKIHFDSLKKLESDFNAALQSHMLHEAYATDFTMWVNKTISLYLGSACDLKLVRNTKSFESIPIKELLGDRKVTKCLLYWKTRTTPERTINQAQFSDYIDSLNLPINGAWLCILLDMQRVKMQQHINTVKDALLCKATEHYLRKQVRCDLPFQPTWLDFTD